MTTYPDYPFAAQHYTHANGLKQHYLDEGPREAAPLLMLHGNPSWSYYWRHLVAGLRDNYRCIVPDHIGMGLSDKPDDSRYEFSLRQRVDDLDTLVEHLIRHRGAPEQGWTLVVHDWGGMIGFAYACRKPERFARLVILNTGAFPNPKVMRLPIALKLGRDSAVGAWLIERFNAFAWGATRFGTKRAMSAEVRAAYLAPYDTPAHRLATLRFVQDIPLGPDDRGFELVRATGKQLAQFANRPALICWGLRDFVFDTDFLDVWKANLPNAEVHAFADAGHYVLEDAHERIVPLVQNFLGRSPAQA